MTVNVKNSKAYVQLKMDARMFVPAKFPFGLSVNQNCVTCLMTFVLERTR